MVYLLKYEWHKFIRTKKNWLVFLLILCSFIGYVSFNGYQNHVYTEAKTEQFSKARQNAMYDITNMANYQFLAKKEKDKQYYGNAIEYFKRLYSCANDLYRDYSTSAVSLDDLIQWNDLLIEGKTKKYTIISYTTYSLDYLKKTQKEYRYLKKNHIPIKHSPYVCTTSNLAVNLSNHYLGAVLLILYFLLIFDIFKEFDQGVYKILFTSKYDTLKIILTKVVFSIFLLIGFIGLIVLLFGVNTLIFGMGNTQYSFSVGNHIYMESKILMYIIFITIAMSLFLIGVYTLISCLFKSTTTSLVITITLYLMVNLFSQNLHKINYFIGFLNVDMFSMLQQNKIFTICIMNIVVLIVCVILSILLLKKRDLIVTGD